MSIIVILSAKAKLESIDEVKNILINIIPKTRAFDGCEWIDIHESKDLNGEFLFYEKWESEEKYDKYFSYRSSSSVMLQLIPLLAVGPSVKKLNLLQI